MNAALAAWNAAGTSEARSAMMACCGAERWADAMVALRPIANVFALSEEADRVWGTMQEADWLEAFACHPRIGERKVSTHAGEQSAAWSRAEQAQASSAGDRVLAEIATGKSEIRGAIRIHLHCVRHRQERGRDAGDFEAAARVNAGDRVARSRRAAAANHANSFGKVVDRMSAITTHVLDTVLGKPAAGIAVRLRNSKAAAGLKFRQMANRRSACMMRRAPGLKLRRA